MTYIQGNNMLLLVDPDATKNRHTNITVLGKSEQSYISSNNLEKGPVYLLFM